jgi:hypothetical protein
VFEACDSPRLIPNARRPVSRETWMATHLQRHRCVRREVVALPSLPHIHEPRAGHSRPHATCRVRQVPCHVQCAAAPNMHASGRLSAARRLNSDRWCSNRYYAPRKPPFSRRAEGARHQSIHCATNCAGARRDNPSSGHPRAGAT